MCIGESLPLCCKPSRLASPRPRRDFAVEGDDRSVITAVSFSPITPLPRKSGFRKPPSRDDDHQRAKQPRAGRRSAGAAGGTTAGELLLVLDEVDEHVVAERLGRREERAPAIDRRQAF